MEHKLLVVLCLSMVIVSILFCRDIIIDTVKNIDMDMFINGIKGIASNWQLSLVLIAIVLFIITASRETYTAPKITEG